MGVVGVGHAPAVRGHGGYRRRRVRDRLTSDMLAAYCGALGIRPFDESFYGPVGQLVENVRIPGNVRTETLQQARVWHGLE